MPRYWYFISNKATQQCIDLVAESPEAARSQVGWQHADCVIITVGEMQAVAGKPPSRATLLAQAAPARSPRSLLR
jgi:hypothetical protein